MKITLTLPGTLTSAFVVAMEGMPVAVESLVPWHVAGHHRKAAVSAFGGPGLIVTHVRSPWKPEGVDLTGDERHLLRRAGQHLLVSTTAPPHTFPTSVQVARATARTLARAYDGLIIDPLTGMTVANCPTCPDEPAEFRLADDWVGWDVHPRAAVAATPHLPGDLADPEGHAHGDRAACKAYAHGDQAGREAHGHGDRADREAHEHGDRADREAYVYGDPAGREACSSCGPDSCGPDDLAAGTSCDPGRPWGCPSGEAVRGGACGGLRVTSRGLRRFGLPEITLDGVACAHRLCAGNVLRMVAHRLVTDHLAFIAAHPGAARRVIDDHLQVERAEEVSGDGGSSFGVRLTPCDADAPGPGSAGSVRRLKVGPIHGTGQIACLRVGPPSGSTGSSDDRLCVTREGVHDARASVRRPGLTPSRALAA
ncbi:hypothetical protein [Nonomuraea cavernae]|uniref:Uncharacterized protein n=1 Tax=Nonomuraea cavernae TaxID=2045107 RepID=A0A917ZI09_9ACTN|nr:hypothetical protein [Nonomuraea cavernae]MCA2188342.1 hypothetical protein [Nonomuraea cavernae]GGO83583.1 hypothetical protein GCM10012289_77350 [Nonomuraea cavernae]